MGSRRDQTRSLSGDHSACSFPAEQGFGASCGGPLSRPAPPNPDNRPDRLQDRWQCRLGQDPGPPAGGFRARSPGPASLLPFSPPSWAGAGTALPPHLLSSARVPY